MANNASLSGLSIDLSELSVDTTPQLGGNLDLNSNNITGTGNINTTGTITASGTITGSSFSGDGSSLSGINTDLVSDTTPQLGGNLDLNSNDITGTGNISTTGNFTLTSTDAGSSAAPELTLNRDSSSPADADYLGQIKFKGDDDGGSSHVYAKITGKIQDASAGTEDGLIEFANVRAGSTTITARLKSDKFQ